MKIDAAGRRSANSRAIRTGLMSASLLLTMVLSACTTVEGTNALVDPGTFEREVMSETLRGVGMMDREQKSENAERRGPLVLPKQTASLPPPSKDLTDQLPVDSASVQIDTTNLTEADLKRLRNARVVDLRSISGRPLTDVEAKQLTARMRAGNMATLGQSKRPLYLPPEEYFTTIGGTDLVCQTPSGDLVALNDNRCPQSVRDQINKIQPKNVGKADDAGGMISSGSKL